MSAIRQIRGIGIGAAILIVVIAVFAIAIRTSRFAGISAECARLASALGQTRVLGSLVYLYCVFAAHGADVATYPWLVAAWAMLVVGEALPRAWQVVVRAKELAPSKVGSVVSVRAPGLAHIRLPSGFPTTSYLVVSGTTRNATVLDRRDVGAHDWVVAAFEGDEVPKIGAVVTYDKGSAAGTAPLGIVSERTDLEVVRLRAGLSEQRLTAGGSVTLIVRNREVHYQITAVTAQEDRILTGIELGYLAVQAIKVGSWSSTIRAFEQIDWLPDLGSLAMPADESEDYKIDSDIGLVRGTKLGVQVSPNEIVTHNTAVLGMLGSGKTRLAVELLKRVLLSGAKAIVIDPTGQYSKQFPDHFTKALAEEVHQQITSAIATKVEEVHKDRHRGGNVGAFQRAVGKVVEAFLNSDSLILVIDPTEFTVSRQSGDLKNKKVGDSWVDSAPLEKLSPPQVVSVFAEACLDQCQRLGESDRARLVLLLEEAHLLIPEWNSVNSDGDRNATNSTAKSIMQGRKFGFGSIVVTQRTANVSKSILSQCHTVFALRMNDRTGMDFLSGQLSPEHLQMLPQLPDQVAIACGRSIASPMPVVIEINDSAMFDDRVWQGQVPTPTKALFGPTNIEAGSGTNWPAPDSAVAAPSRS
jgi:uncharacterized protein